MWKEVGRYQHGECILRFGFLMAVDCWSADHSQ